MTEPAGDQAYHLHYRTVAIGNNLAARLQTAKISRCSANFNEESVGPKLTGCAKRR